MKWIRVASRVAADAKVRQIARDTGSDPYTVVGHLVTLWGVMTEQAKDGDLSPFPDDDVEAWAEWSGRGRKRGLFAGAVRRLLCNERGVMEAWDDYQGAAIREHEADRRRKSGRHPPGPSGGIPAESRRSSGGIPPLRVRDENSTKEVGGGDARAKADPAIGRPAGPAAGTVAGSIAPDQPTAGTLAIALARAANQAVTDVWGESPSPYLPTSGAAHDCAEAVLAAAVPPEFAERAVFTLCKSFCAKAKARDAPSDAQRPGSLLYFPRGVCRLWEREQAATEAAHTPSPAPLPDAPTDPPRFDRPDPVAWLRKVAAGEA